jgi:hypothetical protein
MSDTTITREYLLALLALRREYFLSRMSESVRATGRCEDFPCCGHTDGLGCAWVSPNEVSPVDNLIAREVREVRRAEARAEFDARAVQGGACNDCGSVQIPASADGLCFDCEQDLRDEERREREDFYAHG